MTPAQVLAYDLPLFADLKPSDFGNVVLDVGEQYLPAAQTLFHQNDISTNVYFMLAGQLAALQLTPDGREIIFASFTAGAFFGEVAALDGKPGPLAVIAKTDASILVMQRASFLALFNGVPAIRNKVIRQMAGHVRSLTARNIELATLSVEQRVGAFILRLAAKHGADPARSIIDPAPTHADIAGSIGANREMVSRSISNLARQGMITAARRRIEILDHAALTALVA